uniref:Uncharacterized protein n=1 Tax=Gopherus evgoodei TaxID=1825980 RepID=A0A8C4Y6L2_9SAUR
MEPPDPHVSPELESPQDLRFSDVRGTSVGVTWGPPPPTEDLKCPLQPPEHPRNCIQNSAPYWLQMTLEGLIPGASIMAVRGFEESEPLAGYITTVPDGPSDLSALNVTDISALLRWHPPRAPSRATGPPPRGSGEGGGSSGEREEGVGAAEEGGPVSLSPPPGLDAPQDLRATEVTPGSAQLCWTSSPHPRPAGYLLSYEMLSGQTQIPLGTDAASHQLSNLTPSSRYQLQVQAIRGGRPSIPIITSFNTATPFPWDCAEEQLNRLGPSREVTIYLGGNRQCPLQVYCDMKPDRDGWLMSVFQCRMNGERDFWRDWQDYAQGFGNQSQEFWLGNDALHELTAGGDMVSKRGEQSDVLSYHSGSVFLTRDPNPNRLLIRCMVSYRGAWWYRNCHYANLNGLHGSHWDHQGVNWFNWKGFEFSIPFTEMKLWLRGSRGGRTDRWTRGRESE